MVGGLWEGVQRRQRETIAGFTGGEQSNLAPSPRRPCYTSRPCYTNSLVTTRRPAAGQRARRLNVVDRRWLTYMRRPEDANRCAVTVTPVSYREPATC